MKYATRSSQSFDAEILRQELVAAIGPQGWYLNTSSGMVEFVPTGINALDPEPVILAHFTNGPAREITKGKAAIDQAAEAVRLRYLDGQAAKLAEYQRAYDAAVTWLADQAQPAPVAVQSWADAKGWTAAQAAADIKAAGDYLNAKLDQIRDVRLKGKAELEAGTKTEAEVLAALGAL